jgi:hypothetical protein
MQHSRASGPLRDRRAPVICTHPVGTGVLTIKICVLQIFDSNWDVMRSI